MPGQQLRNVPEVSAVVPRVKTHINDLQSMVDKNIPVLTGELSFLKSALFSHLMAVFIKYYSKSLDTAS